MKKWLLLLIVIFISGCNVGDMTNTPTKKVEELLSNYQSLNKKVLDDLDDIIAREENFNTEHRNKYRDIMKKHYQNLRYNIKDEEVDGDRAIVTVEIEVTDYSQVLRDSDLYLDENPEQFQNEKGEYDQVKYNDYRLKELDKVTDKVKYTLELTVNKEDNKWVLQPLSSTDEEKIHGIYLY